MSQRLIHQRELLRDARRYPHSTSLLLSHASKPLPVGNLRHTCLSRRHASISPKNCLHEPDFRVNKQGNHASKSTQAACSMRLDGKNILYTQSNSLNTTMLLETYTDALYFVSFTVFLCVTILQVLPLIDWIPSSTPTMQEQPKITTTMDHPHPFLLRI